jgi:N-acetyl-anhydromuramyl-L-alanine amidase AmpD
MQIDATSYNKAAVHPQRWGYQARGGAAPSTVIIHTTSNKRATRFQTEAEFLCDSKDVSAHFLISKTGEIIQFLDPLKWQAWHAGAALPAYLNARSIGIEHHVSIGEAWTEVQHAASTWLVRQLMQQFSITPLRIDTHRAVALPKGRKSDPTGWDDGSFYAWRDALAVSLPPTRYRVRGVPIHQAPDVTSPVALGGMAILVPGTEIQPDQVKDGWAHVPEGFIDAKALEAV